MHPNSMRLMGDFIKSHVGRFQGGRVLDVGSQNINGSYREIFFPHVKEYIGCDIVAGAGVDVLVEDMDHLPFKDGEFDAVISGQTLEHAAHPWILVKEIARVTKSGGAVCLIAPWRFYEHKDALCPFDRWRILSDGMITLMTEAGLVTPQAFMDEDDCVGIAFKS